MRSSSAIRRWVAASAAAVVALGLGLGPAAANPADTVDVPTAVNRAPSHEVVFAGAGVTVVRGSGGVLWRSTGAGWTVVAEDVQGPRQAGGVLWWRPSDGGESIVRLDPVAGTTTTTPLPTGYAALVSEVGHVTEDENGGFVYVEGGTTRPLPGADRSPTLFDLSTTAYLATVQGDDDTTILRLVPLDGTSARDVVTLPSGSSVGTARLTPTSVFWTAEAGDAATTVNRQPLAGGAIETAPFEGYVDDFRADSDTVLFTTYGAPPQVFTGGTLRAVEAPPGVALRTAAAGGGRFLLWGTGVDRSGVYSVDPATGQSTKVLATPETRVSVENLTVNAGKVWGVDRRDGENGTGAAGVVWNRTMGSTPGAETVLPYRSSAYAAFSANRILRSDNAVGAPVTVTTYDGATRTASFTTGSVRHLSGPYLSGYSTTGDQQVRRVDGSVVFTPPSGTSVAALFGSRVYYTDGSVVWLRDVAQSSSIPPRKIATCACSSWTAAWGDWFVYAHSETGAIKAINIATGAVTSPSAGGYPNELTVDDGVVAWSDSPAVIKAWNPAKNGGATTVVTDAWRFDIDDGRIAWQDTQNGVHYGSLPYGGTSRPRFLGAMPTPSVFAPGAPGQPTAWTPQWDLTKDLASWTVTIKSGSTTVRTLTGTTVNASVRPSWNGRNTAGKLVPNGTYTWTLTGSAADGSGAVAGLDGTSAVSGTVRVGTTPPAGVMTNAALSSSVSATATIPVTWKATGLAPGATVSYSVQYRTVTVNSAGSRVYSAPVNWVTGTLKTSKTYTGAPGRVVQFRVQATDSTGRVGAWSAYRTTTFPIDDRALTRTGTWLSKTSSSYYLGTYRAASTKGAALSRTANRTSAVSVIGSRSPSGGKVQVYVDGRLRATVDTYAAKGAYRQVLWSAAVPYGKHTVKLVVLPTNSTRKYAYVDGVAFGL